MPFPLAWSPSAAYSSPGWPPQMFPILDVDEQMMYRSAQAFFFIRIS